MIQSKHIKIWGFLYLLVYSGFAYTQINLDSCIEMALRNYPLQNHNTYIETIGSNAIKRVNSQMYPQLSFKAQTTYQSEVSEINIPGINTITTPHNNYSFGLELNQVIFGFGKYSQAKEVKQAQTIADIQKNEINLYALQSVIVELYSNILIRQANIKVLRSYKTNIQYKYNDLQNAVANGLALQSNLDVLYAEIQKTDLQLIEAQYDVNTYIQTLAMYTHTSVDTNAIFSPIDRSKLFISHTSLIRPEKVYYENQIQVIDESIKLEKLENLPSIFVFGEGSYGRPGYDFLNHDTRFFGMLGVGLSWNLNNIYNNSLSSQNMECEKSMIYEQKMLFDIQQNSELIKKQNEIDKYTHLIEIDKSILESRTKICITAANQLENGIITSTEYLTQLFEQKQAELSVEIHQIQLQVTIIEYNISAGTI